jgi:hypothetical protein
LALGSSDGPLGRGPRFIALQGVRSVTSAQSMLYIERNGNSTNLDAPNGARA